MDFVDFNTVIKNNEPEDYSANKAPSPLDCYIKARDFGHDIALEKAILKSDNGFASYMYARNISGADIRAHIQHIQHITHDSTMKSDEKTFILDELRNML